MFGVFREFTPLVQGLSLDEAFLDVTHSQAALGSGETIARAIKQRILARTGLTASVGVAPNKLVAKIASDLRKPDGLVLVTEADVTALLDPLPVRRLFGIGNKTAPRLEEIGIQTLRDLRLAPEAVLQPVFGRYAARVKARAAGIDDRPVVADWDEKQISAEETFDIDLADHVRLHAELARLTDRTAERLRRQGWLAGRVVVKIRRKDFKTYTRQCTVHPATDHTSELARAAAVSPRPVAAATAPRRYKAARRRRERTHHRTTDRSVRCTRDRTSPTPGRSGRRHSRQVRHDSTHPRQLARSLFLASDRASVTSALAVTSDV